MKTITIGRGDGANIIIDNEMISRRHAILKISTFGKMEIVDMGRNGTFVNGIKLRPNVPFPVTRKDVVRFADQNSPFKLDWSQVPDNSKIYKIAIAAIACLLAIILLVVLIRSCSSDEENTPIVPANIEISPSQAPSGSSSSATATESDNKEDVAEGNHENGKETESKEKDTEEAKKQKDIEGKTIQELFPQAPEKKNTNSGKKGSEPVKPSNVKTKNNSKDGHKASDKNKTVII